MSSSYSKKRKLDSGWTMSAAKKRKTVSAKRSKSGGAATKAFVKRQIKKNQELKFFDLTGGADNVDYTGLTYDLVAIAQGDTDITRDGDKIMPTSMQIRMSFNIGDATNVMRLVVFRWKGYDSVDAPTTAKIFQFTGSIIGPRSPFLHDQRSRFEVLLDELINLDAGHTMHTLNTSFALAKKQIEYNAGTTVGMNKLYMCVISDSGAATHPTVTFGIRTYFTDS